MCDVGRKSILRRLDQGQKEMVASLRKLADRIGKLTPADPYEVTVWVQPHVERLLAEGERILEANGCQQDRGRKWLR
jgi:hypothetical protein